MAVDIASLHTLLSNAGLPVVGVAYYAHAGHAAYVAAVAPVVWMSLADADMRIDLSRALTAEEQAQAEGLIASWAETL
jgi:hypothetical protein